MAIHINIIDILKVQGVFCTHCGHRIDGCVDCWSNSQTCGKKIQTSQKWQEWGDAQISGFDTHCNNNCGHFCETFGQICKKY